MSVAAFLKFICLFAILFTTGVYSQNMVTLFGSELPDEVLSSEQLLNMAGQNLDSRASLNPELVYLYIEYLNHLYETKDKQSETAVFDYMRKLTQEAYLRRNAWAGETKKFIAAMNADDKLKETSISYLNDYINTTTKSELVESAGYAIDKNKMNFIVYKLYKESPSAVYDSNTDYAVLRSEAETEARGKLMNISKAEMPESEKISLILSRWYLFGGGDEDAVPRLLFSIIDNEISIKEENTFFISAGYTPKNDINIDYNYLISEIDHSESGEFIPSIPQFNIGAGYIFYLKPIRSFLSYLKIEAGYLKSMSDAGTSPGINIDEVQVDTIQSATVQRVTKKLTYGVNNLSAASVSSVYFKVTLPVYYITNSLLLEVGIGTVFHSFNYDLKFSYDYSYLKQNYSTMTGTWNTISRNNGTGSKEESIKDTQFLLLPSVSVIYNFPFNSALELNYSLKSARANITVYF